MKSMIIPALLFILTMTITPGPNNMMLTASGARFGYQKTIPLIFGMVMGMLVLLVLSALGMGIIFERFPFIQKILKVLGSLYLLFLAYSIAFPRHKAKAAKLKKERPLGILQGMGFQFLNPKVYFMTITAMSVYPLSGSLYFKSILVIIFGFMFITPCSISLWALCGTVIGRFMENSKYSRFINISLGGITAASVAFILI